MYIAHVRKSDGEKQLLKDHLTECAELSADWGGKIGLRKTSYLAGLLHDLGKYSNEFQVYLKKAVADPKSVTRGSVDHSTAGGKLLFDYCHKNSRDPFSYILAELVGNAIISHHSSRGLQDFFTPEGEANSDYLRRVDEIEVVDYEQIKSRFFQEIMSEEQFQKLLLEAIKELKGFYQKDGKSRVKQNDTFFLLKFIYSCLLDADRTNTMLFEENKVFKRHENDVLLQSYSQSLEEYIATFTADTPINQLRGQMSDQCKAFAERKTGIYTLSIPTGGGKTLASLRFALNHAIKYGKERIIYVVPFTTIIEQNAATVREILKDEVNILEHHSNVFTDQEEMKERQTEESEAEKEALEQKQALLKDNWESPVIFTTMVQFLNTIYSRGTRNPRRFHNLTNAVIIFDEAQGVPTNCTHLFNESLNFLKNYGTTTSVLCTATQPSLENVGRALAKESDGEMVANLSEVESKFKRVEVIDRTTDDTWTLEELAEFSQEILTEKENLLIILNTKKAVRRLYQYLENKPLENIELYHLSTSMCAKHRKNLLDELREKLTNSDTKLICITTQLIEAGVDISFQSVIRSAAGLDSIAQAAGRCNRHGETRQQPVYLINLSADLENLTHLPEIKQGQEITLDILKESSELEQKELLSHDVQKRYFDRYYDCFKDELNYPVKKTSLNLFSLLGEGANALEHYKRTHGSAPLLAFRSSPKTVGKYFQVIDSPTTSVLVPYEKGNDLIADLNGELRPEEYAPTLKKAQQYMVNVFQHELMELQKTGSIYPLLNGDVLALTSNAYNLKFGIDLEAEAASGYLGF
ncbi:CRISPR-associated helicase cas3 [Enterococcus moraviensis ATCC BAA-383]|uniref:CRISPR-associated helicase cas3 n=1 Tax=Enterococcus moraviensis ATCC BAA-383 TaxID=1158609 RepID=R2QIM8_9ENTE|nr:CRISPR-associated helicase/endonuclease Cas3 [Enterococcus moraviensis]EOH96447.1 CRISPR-associated helicase cas3 [Enterococcus moraviensis ATCC BAA-383]EOT65873.1 CRISPR-associated helicase cas3 [Enterococcus moraviensis ATCC BAA-383]